MSSDVKVGVVGATGALGGEVLKVLDQAPWRPDIVVALARAATSASHVAYGDEQLVVDDVEHEALDELDAVILTVPASEARSPGEAALEGGAAVVDASGVLLADGDVPLVVPWINPEALASARRRVVAVPRPAGLLLGSILGPLRRAGLTGRCTSTVMLPASAHGRDGIDELSRQVVALFNSGTPPRKVFPTGLAFDLLPAVGPLDEQGFSRAERRASAEAQVLSGWEGEVATSIVGVPLFSGVSASVDLGFDRSVPLELIRQVLADGGLRLPEDASVRSLPRPRRVEGEPFAHIGRLRQRDDGTVQLFATMDNLRGTAAVLVALAAALLGDRIPRGGSK